MFLLLPLDCLCPGGRLVDTCRVAALAKMCHHSAILEFSIGVDGAYWVGNLRRCVCRLLFWSTRVLTGSWRMVGCWSAENLFDDEARMFCWLVRDGKQATQKETPNDKTYEEDLGSSSEAFQVPPSSIEQAWVNTPISKRFFSNFEYFQTLILPSIYFLESHFWRRAPLTLYFVAHPQFTSLFRSAWERTQHLPTLTPQHLQPSKITLLPNSTHEQERLLCALAGLSYIKSNLDNPPTLSKPCLVEVQQRVQMR